MKNKEKIIESIICIVFIFMGVLLGDILIDHFEIKNLFGDVFIRGVIFSVFFGLSEAIAKLINNMLKEHN